MQFRNENGIIHCVFQRTVIDRLLTLLIHDNATRIDFFYLHACDGVIEHSFNENITELKIICLFPYYGGLVFHSSYE